MRSMSYMGDSVHNVCQKGCMNINWKSLFTKSILFEIHITCIDDYHNALCSGCLNCNWNIMLFRRGVWISTWIAYSSSLRLFEIHISVLKGNIMPSAVGVWITIAMLFRRGVWISTWIAYSYSLLKCTLSVLKIKICLLQWVCAF